MTCPSLTSPDTPRAVQEGQLSSLAEDVGRGLAGRPRRLPAYALYDALGSSLFDAICRLPWYPITRSERGLLGAHRRAILEAAGRRVRLVELGPGNGDKLATLLQGPLSGHPPHEVHLVDVSATALEDATLRLQRLRGVHVHAHVARYEVGLREVAQLREPGESVLVAFLGSNIGNFDPADADAMLAAIRTALQPGDTLLIGADLVKPIPQLQLAYDDPLGVTAAFNRNVLVRLNRELRADFAIERFTHAARWNANARRMEMHLVSDTRQRVAIPGAGLVIDLEPGESIWTESSYKYDRDGFGDVLRRAGLVPAASWFDQDAGFLLTLAAAR